MRHATSRYKKAQCADEVTRTCRRCRQRYKTVEESMVLLADPTAIQDMDKREEEVARSARATAKKL